MEVVSMARKGVNAAAQKAFDSWASTNDYPMLSEILPFYLDDHDSILLETILLEFGGFLLTEFKGAKSTKEKYFETVIFLLRRANKGHSIDNDAEVSRLSLALKNHLNRKKSLTVMISPPKKPSHSSLLMTFHMPMKRHLLIWHISLMRCLEGRITPVDWLPCLPSTLMVELEKVKLSPTTTGIGML